MPVSCPSGCSFVEAGRQTEPLDFAYQARVHPNPFSSNLRTSPSLSGSTLRGDLDSSNCQMALVTLSSIGTYWRREGWTLCNPVPFSMYMLFRKTGGHRSSKCWVSIPALLFL